MLDAPQQQQDRSAVSMSSAHVGTVLFLLKRIDCYDGVASHIETLAGGLTRAGWRIVLATGPVYQKEIAQSRYEAIRSEVFEWLVFEQFEHAKDVLSLCALVSSLIGKYDVKIVHIHGMSLLPLSALLRAITACRVVVSYHPSAHGDDPGQIRHTLPKRTLVAFASLLLLCRPDSIVAFSTRILDLYTRILHYPARRVEKILLGVDTDHFTPPNHLEREIARSSLLLRPEDVVVVLPGRLNLNKGHDIVIAAATRLQEELPDASIRYVFPGAGHQSERIKQLVKAAPASEQMFLFPGYLKDIRTVLFAADIVVLPSRHEGFGLVVAEAMACGLPVIRTPSGGFEDQIVEGVTGYGVPFNDPVALAERIASLIDSAARRRIGVAARKHALRFSQKKMISDTQALYGRLLGVTELVTGNGAS